MKIKDIRKKTGLSQSQFAEKYDIPVRTIQQWEQEISQPAPYVISMLEKQIEKKGSKKSKKSYITGRNIDPGNWVRAEAEDFMNENMIHPLQRRKVKELIEKLEGKKEINKITIFGSSVTRKCHVGSDLDIYVEIGSDKKINIGDLDFDYDLWTNYTADNRLKEEIARTGVKVYVN